jgi:hypothetical protein
VEQNDYGRIGSLFRRASPLIEHDDEHEHDCPNFGALELNEPGEPPSGK